MIQRTFRLFSLSFMLWKVISSQLQGAWGEGVEVACEITMGLFLL